MRDSRFCKNPTSCRRASTVATSRPLGKVVAADRWTRCSRHRSVRGLSTRERGKLNGARMSDSNDASGFFALQLKIAFLSKMLRFLSPYRTGTT